MREFIRIKILIFLFLASLNSCQSNIDTQLLVGTWKQTDVPDTSPTASLTLTFSNTGLVEVHRISNGRLKYQYSGKYTVNQKTNMLAIIYKDITLDSEIVSLSENELKLYEMDSRQYSRYLRYSFE